ncbi:MAG: SLC13 family permease [Bacteroidales bacterium]|nr:SLC13 family permease [Bacteroidales bacterium]
MLITLAILLVAIGFFISGKIRSDLVALCALIFLVLFGILTPTEALSGFSNPIVIMMIGLFVVGGGIFRTGLANVVSRKILNLAGTNQTKLFIFIILITSSIGAFVSNTGTVAMLMPIVVGLAVGANVSPSRFLMPLAFASSFGAMLTLIGTAPNLVIDGVLRDAGFKGLSFFSFLPIGLISIMVGGPVLFILSRLFLNKDEDVDDVKKSKSLKDLANEYQLHQNLVRVQAVRGSALIGQMLRDLELPQKYNLNVLELRRRAAGSNPLLKMVTQNQVGPDTIILENDVLYLSGLFEQVRLFVADTRSFMIDMNEKDENPPTFGGKIRFDEIGIVELVVLFDSQLIGQPVKACGFREKYKVNILGIRRQKDYILQDVKDEKIHAGDVLLAQGKWSDIARLKNEASEWVVVGEPQVEASKVTFDEKAPIAAAIMIAMVALMAFNVVPAVVAVLLAAIGMVLTKCFRNVEEAYKTINWEVVVLIGAMLPMSIAFEKTGTAVLISETLVANLGSYGPMVLMAGIYLATSILTMFISNTATAVLFAPIAMHSAMEFGVSPYPFLFAVCVAANMCFASPFSTPPNALVLSAGRYSFMDYVKVGLPLQIIMGIVMVLVLPLLWPF